MVVLSASIINKSGKPLLSRQFVDMSRVRIEGYLSAFPKLVGTGKEHTYVETENVRYVYQPMESLFLLLVTNKQSNILEDLCTLRLLSKLVPEYAYSLDDDGICKSAFEHIFAFDEVISFGHKENVTIAQIHQYCEMNSHEEELSKEVKRYKEDEVSKYMKQKVIEIEKRKIVRRGEKGGFSPLQSGSGRIDSSFGNDTRLSSTGGGSVLGFSPDFDSLPHSKGQPPASASATAPPKVPGLQLGKTKSTNKFLESLKADGEIIVEDVKPSIIGHSKASAPVTLTAEEKLNITLKRDGGLYNFDVHGTLSLQNLDLDNGHIQVKIETGGNHGIQYRTHPNINKELFSNENIIGLKDPNRPFPTGQSGDGGVGLLKWRMQTGEEKLVPLSINCWPSFSGKDTYVNIEYEASSMFDLHNVVISVPVPALREGPVVQQIDGDWRYDPRNCVLEWSIVLIDNSNRSGSMEFIVPAADPSVFSPISVRFTSANTFSDLKVVNIIPLRGGNPPKFSQRTLLSTDTYQVV